MGWRDQLFPEGWQFMTMNLYEFMHMWLMDAPQKIIPPILMFKGRRELENIPMGIKKK